MQLIHTLNNFWQSCFVHLAEIESVIVLVNVFVSFFAIVNISVNVIVVIERVLTICRLQFAGGAAPIVGLPATCCCRLSIRLCGCYCITCMRWLMKPLSVRILTK